jgi:signal peptidase II
VSSAPRPWAWYGLALAVLAADQLTKAWASASLMYGVPVVVLPVFDLTLLHNTGAAFSLLADQPGWQRWLFSGLAVGISGLLAWWLWRLPADGHRLERWAFTLVLGGALGNLVDRVRLGYVVDFLHFHWDSAYFPAFNLADSAITVGAALLILDAFRPQQAGSA